MIKKIISLFLCMLLCITGFSVFVNAAETNNMSIIFQINNPNMTVNGVQKQIDRKNGISPIIRNGRTLLPIRATVEEMGGSVNWNEENKQITLNYNGDTIVLTVDLLTALLNGNSQTLDTAPAIINNETFLPIRFIAESFGYNVNWNANTKEIEIIKNKDESTKNNESAAQIDFLFGKGDLNPSSNVFTGTSYLNNLIQTEDVFNFPSTYNVTFEPCTRTDWHSHNGGQILLVTEGIGIYQEEGQPARLMQPGDVIMAEPGVKHWHGASDNNWFAHVGISTNPDNSSTNWMEKVNDEEYNAAVAQAKANTKIKTDNTHVFDIGDINPSANVFTGVSYLNNLVQTDDIFNCAPVYNVTFEPCTRTDWHSHHGGQILLVTEGTGIYQEEGQPARLMQPGDVIMAEPNVKHWHGASDSGMFAHLGISTNPDNSEVDWLEKVSDDEYNKAVAQAKGETVSETPAESTDNNTEEENNTLVVYFSRTGTTKSVAENIAEITNSDITEITPVTPYPDDYNACIKQAEEEIDNDFRPEINVNAEDLDKYDTIIIGYPIWYSTTPPPVATFLANNDLNGKTIIPFCTSGGSGISGSVRKINEICKDSTIAEGFNATNASEASIIDWLKSAGLDIK